MLLKIQYEVLSTVWHEIKHNIEQNYWQCCQFFFLFGFQNVSLVKTASFYKWRNEKLRHRERNDLDELLQDKTKDQTQNSFILISIYLQVHSFYIFFSHRFF